MIVLYAYTMSKYICKTSFVAVMDHALDSLPAVTNKESRSKLSKYFTI